MTSDFGLRIADCVIYSAAVDWIDNIPDWLAALAAVIGALGTLLGVLGFRNRGKKLKDASRELEETGKKISENEEVIRALVIAVEKFRTDVKAGRYGAAAKNDLPDIARLIQAFAEELGVEGDLSAHVRRAIKA